jgi:osomolarity two-component system response regulator SKN7
MHLKAIQQMARIPRSIGVPPLSDSAFEQALTVQAQASNLMAANGGDRQGTPGGSDDEGKINPLAGMGLTDEQYSMILQNLVNGEPFMGISGLNPADLTGASSSSSKRPLDDGQDQERSGKRGRFEIVE